jgi:integrase
LEDDPRDPVEDRRRSGRDDARREAHDGKACLLPNKQRRPAATDDRAFGEWIEQRKLTHRTWADDQGRWKNHFAKPFGDREKHSAFADRQAHTIGAVDLEAFILAKLKGGMNPATVGHCLRLLSRVFGYLVRHSQRTGVRANPVRSLDKTVRRLYKPTHDPKSVPFIEKLDDIKRIIEALTPPYHVMFAVGAYAGLRPGEVKALSWSDIDLGRSRITVRRQVVRGGLGPLKDDETRVVPVLDAPPLLANWLKETGGVGYAFVSVALKRGGRRKSDVPLITNDHTLLDHLDEGMTALSMERLTWYQATRHTFASQWVLNGGSIEKLAAILGHSSTWVTERYAHIKPDLFLDAELGRLGGHRDGASGHQVATKESKPKKPSPRKTTAAQ